MPSSIRSSIEYIIANRVSREGRSTMERVAMVAVALSVGVMILTLAVIFGFKRDIEIQLTALSGDMVVASHYGASPSVVEPVARSERVDSLVRATAQSCGLYTSRVAPFTWRGATLSGVEGVEGVVLKGVDENYNTELLEGAMVRGEMLDFESEKPSRGALIAESLAAQMQLEVGARLELLMIDDGGGVRRDLYRVGGIFSAGLGEAERLVVLTDLRNVQRVNGWNEGQVSGYEVWLSHDREGRYSAIDYAPLVSYALNGEVIYLDGEEFSSICAYSIQSLHPAIFDWLIAHNVNAAVIIAIMLIVAIFNIITALLIMVLERTQMIGVLKSLGMTNRSIRKIFLWRAFGVVLRGLVWGNGVGVALCIVQQQFKIISLDQSGYLLSTVPISLSGWWLAMLNIGVVAVVLIMVTLPTRFATTIEPSKAIKYQ